MIVMICLTSIHVLSNVPYGSCYILRRNKGDDSCDGIIHVLLVFLLISMHIIVMIYLTSIHVLSNIPYESLLCPTLKQW
jgi:hypothetical protein